MQLFTAGLVECRWRFAAALGCLARRAVVALIHHTVNKTIRLRFVQPAWPRNPVQSPGGQRAPEMNQMPMVPFMERFPELGARETRSVTVTQRQDLPDGE